MTDEPRETEQRSHGAGADDGHRSHDAAAGGGRPPRRPAKPRAGWVFGGALGAFFVVLALLAFQVRAGQDPALGPAEPVAQVQKPKPRRILIRKVIKRVVIHHPPTGSPAPAQTSAPRTTTSSPAPAPPPAPAPAPAPAPLTTQSS
jgi:hypothetical protein